MGSRVLLLLVVALAGGCNFLSRTPHERYASDLKRHGLAETDAGRIWLRSAEQSLTRPSSVRLPRRATLAFTADEPRATAFAVTLRRGQRFVAETHVDSADRTMVFVDVFERDELGLRHIASAAPDEVAVILDMVGDAEYIVRVQPEVGRDIDVTVALRTEPTLAMPVQNQNGKIGSFFGDLRDSGRRDHEGVDIFAPRGTPVVAAADGIVSSVGTNGLGGNVVWIARPGRGEFHYYAHLDRHAVTPGTLIERGEVVGTVGNTGNARQTAPHLHFGIYTPRGAVDPLPYLAR